MSKTVSDVSKILLVVLAFDVKSWARKTWESNAFLFRIFMSPLCRRAWVPSRYSAFFPQYKKHVCEAN